MAETFVEVCPPHEGPQERPEDREGRAGKRQECAPRKAGSGGTEAGKPRGGGSP